MSTLDARKNFAITELSTGYAVDATSIVVATNTGSKFPNPSTDGEFNLVWWNYSDYKDPSDDPYVEIVRCTARTTDTMTVVRAQEGTGATVKNIQGKVYKLMLGLTAKAIGDIETQIDSKLPKLNRTVRAEIRGIQSADTSIKLIDMETGSATFPNGVKIKSIYVKSAENDPAEEMDSDLKYCDAQGNGAFPSTNVTSISTLDTVQGNKAVTGLTTTIATNKVVYLNIRHALASATGVWWVTVNYDIL